MRQETRRKKLKKQARMRARARARERRCQVENDSYTEEMNISRWRKAQREMKETSVK